MAENANQEFIKLVERNKNELGVSYSMQNKKAGFGFGFINNVRGGKSKAGDEDILKLLDVFPRLDQNHIKTTKSQELETRIRALEDDLSKLKEKVVPLILKYFEQQKTEK